MITATAVQLGASTILMPSLELLLIVVENPAWLGLPQSVGIIFMFNPFAAPAVCAATACAQAITAFLAGVAAGSGRKKTATTLVVVWVITIVTLISVSAFWPYVRHFMPLNPRPVSPSEVYPTVIYTLLSLVSAIGCHAAGSIFTRRHAH